MRKVLLLLTFICAVAQADNSGDFVRFQYDYFDFTDSKQKEYGNRGTVHFKKGYGGMQFQVAYEKTVTETCKPPLKENLNVDKLIARYDQKLFESGRYHLGIIAVRDNLVPTDGGRVFNLGYMHRLTPGAALEGLYFFAWNPLVLLMAVGDGHNDIVLVALVLLANNLRDIFHDESKGILTLPIVIGQRNGLRLYSVIVILAYLGIIGMAVTGPLNLWSLIVLLSLPLALKLLHQMMQEIPDDADAQTAKLDTAFGILLVASLVLEGLF